MNLSQYQTLVFDCDGVVLNSNKVKTDAFYQAALPYGKAAANQLVEYHKARGGISRYKKFEWFIETVVAGKAGPSLQELLDVYAKEVRQGLLTCEIAEGLAELRAKTLNANWLIVSGGDQQELREVFNYRKLSELFDGGIFGSPDTKELILQREISLNNIKEKALFIGDSKYDFEVSSVFSFDFFFVSAWSEFDNWQAFFENKNNSIYTSVSELLRAIK